MNVAALIDTVEALGVHLFIDAGGLLCDAPDTPEADRLIALIARHKPAVMAELMRPPTWLLADPGAAALLRAGLSPDEVYDVAERLAIEDCDRRMAAAEHLATLPDILRGVPATIAATPKHGRSDALHLAT